MKLTDFLSITKPLNRKGAFSHWFAQIGDITAYGKSQEEVTTDALTRAKAALTGDYEPVLLFNEDRSEYVLCYRTPWQGWSYCIRDIAARVNQGGWTSGFESREECVEYARKHLASASEIELFDVTPALMAAEAREFYTSATGIEEGGF